MPGLVGKVIPSQDVDQKGTDPVYFVVIFLDGSAPFQSSGLSIKTLKGNVRSLY
jgi:hypothetical protein